jgi:hypothetical protein
VKTKIAILFLLSITFLTACGGVTPVPITETPTPKIAAQTITPSPTNTPIATPYDWWETPTPETVPGYPTALMPVELDPFAKNVPVEQTDISAHDLYIGKYVIRKWCKEDESIKDYCSITISSLGEKQVEIWGFPVYLGEETGTDLTERGIPDIVIISSQGNPGAIIKVFEAGNTLKEIMNVWSTSPRRFVDLNNDKTYEFITTERIWSQFITCNVSGIPLVYEYNPDTGYVNKTSKYKEVLSTNIQWGTDYLSTYKLENPNTEVPVCNVYYLVTAYLVSGQKEKAWDILDENYSPEKAAEYKVGFEKDLENLIP